MSKSDDFEYKRFQRETSPPVSILKPLKGLDDNLFDNLNSFCAQDYPEYEIVFSLQDQNDPAYRLARKIRDKHPDKDIKIIIEKCSAGLKPKVNNLIPAYEASKYDYILISDSNVMVDKDYLQHVMRFTKDPDVGLVSNLIRGVGGRSIGAIFENLHLNSFVIGSVCFMHRFFRMPCVVGKSMLMRREALDQLGGFEAVSGFLAEDYIIGQKMHKMGKKVVLSGHMVTNFNEYWSIAKFLNRHTRWAKLRWKLGGARYFGELMGNAVFISCIPIIFCEPSVVTIAFASVVNVIKAMGDYYLGKRIGAAHRGFLYLLSPVKDLTMGIVWFIPLVDSKVVWRGNKYRIGKGSLLQATSS